MESTVEKMEFKSELRQVLHIITHSLYSHKEVFLRELISNASDAIDKIRFNSISNETTPLEGNRDWKIKISVAKDARTLTITDNGIGMTRESIIENLGTIAKSGTKAFLEALKAADASSRPDLIGQFGVGFYSSFMVADKVTVISRMAGTPASEGVRWESDGTGEFTVEQVEKTTRGTDVIVHLKKEEEEFLDEWKIRTIVRQFSDFVEHPVVMDVEKKEEKETKTVEETLNSRKAIWLRPKSEVTEEEHEGFYQQISHNFDKPVKIIHYAGEGTHEFKVLLYIPSKKAFDLSFGDAKFGPKLYIRRVLIMDNCDQLLPPYLRFVKGVVDCADLPLNVSREMLQQNPILEKIKKNIVSKILKTLEEMKKTEYDKYLSFFKELGSILKEGLSRDWSNREQLADLLLMESINTPRNSFTTFEQYVVAMPSEQKDIYYLTGESRSHIEHAPYLEALKEKGWDVLLFTDPVDEFILPSLQEYKAKKLKAADKADVELPDKKEHAEDVRNKFAPLLSTLKEKLNEVKEIRLSTRLKESASCLVSEEGAIGAHMERLMQRMGQMEQAEHGKRIMELNPEHTVVQSMLALFLKDAADERLENYGRLLYEQAVIAEGSKLSDPSAFARRVNELMVNDLERMTGKAADQEVKNT
ncbi:MAG TPA: molecular chaperone HtpG [Bacteroidota bacterium]